ncbi:MAG: PTS sugar transporter subunit IIA, partial [Desulfatiglandales bacterium]
MVGLLFITHCGIGKEIIKASELILGPLEAVDHISIESLLDSEELIANVREKIKALDKGDGVLIMTDMFGGTPCNISI